MLQAFNFGKAIEDLLVNGEPGGYWRYPITEHVLTYNTHFPPEQMLDEIRANLRNLIACYPSTQNILAEHVGRLVNANPSMLAVGNGTVELIQFLIKNKRLRIALAIPSFGIYEDAAKPDRVCYIALRPPEFRVDVDEVLHCVLTNQLDAAVLISPNNPTSLSVRREELLYLARELARADKLLILDESFVEFARLGKEQSLQSNLSELSSVIIIKSLGKIYGICGSRVGYALSSNERLISDIRQEIPLWNLNAIAEYFIVNLPRFRAEFGESIEIVKRECDLLHANLAQIPGGNALRPDGNFIFFHLPDDWPTGSELASRVLREHSILVRHCGGKTMEGGIRYLRISARTEKENGALVAALVESARESRSATFHP